MKGKSASVPRSSAETLRQRLQDLQVACRKAGVRLTPQRLEVFREVASRLDHPDAERVFRAVRTQMPAISLDTVYRTLLLLRDMGLITALGPRRESVRFDGNTTTHDHYVCMRCGMTRDVGRLGIKLPEIPHEVAQLGSVVGTRVEVRGICRVCARVTDDGTGTRKGRGGAK